jgi:hypothetical protein
MDLISKIKIDFFINTIRVTENITIRVTENIMNSTNNPDLIRPKLFLSAIQTTTMRDYLINTYTDGCEIKTSNHVFNRLCHELDDIKQDRYDLYENGYKVQIEFSRLFKDVAFKAHADNMGLPLPAWSINKCKYSSLNEVTPIINWLRNHNTDNSNITADNIELFIITIQTLDKSTIQELDQWDSIVTDCNILDTYKDNLNINGILQAFGATDETANCARIAEYTTLSEHTLNLQVRFYDLIDILSCCELKGHNSDYINLACIMTRFDQGLFKQARFNTTNEREAAVASLMNEFVSLVLERSYEFLWMPDIIISDFTLGSIAGWVILSYLHEARGTQLQTIVQLCPGAESLTGIITCADAGSFIDPDAYHLHRLQYHHLF